MLTNKSKKGIKRNILNSLQKVYEHKYLPARKKSAEKSNVKSYSADGLLD